MNVFYRLTLSIALVASVITSEAAISPLSSTNDYFYIIPKTTNIAGRVMGENGDYRLIRNEDVSFMNEAFCERHNLAFYGFKDFLNGDEEILKPGPVISGPGYYNWWIKGYWIIENLHESAITNEIINVSEWGALGYPPEKMDFVIGVASSDSSRRIEFSYDDIPRSNRHKLISMSLITNLYSEAKKMKTLIAITGNTATNVSSKIEEEDLQISYSNNVEYSRSTYKYTNDATTISFDLYALGRTSISISNHGIEWKETFSDKDKLNGGDCDIEMSFSDDALHKYTSTNCLCWTRGSERPVVVVSAHAWAVATARVYWERESYTTYDSQRYQWDYYTHTTNATVLIDLGGASFLRIVPGDPYSYSNGDLVYRINSRKSPSYILDKLSALADWIPSYSDFEKFSIPPTPPVVSSSGWSSYASQRCDISIRVSHCYLILDVRPISSLDGW